MATDIAAASDLETLRALNDEYIRSVQTSNMDRFAELLADDFRCSNPDGTIVDRDGFLRQTARPTSLADIAALDVEVRLIGDCAIIHARTTFILPDGTPGAGRYTDVWTRQNGQWRAVAAHVTRC